MLRHFLQIDDVSPQELEEILNYAEVPPSPLLSGRGVALVFEKPSLRTRNSAEMAVVELDGHPAYITNAEISLDVRESVEDVTRTLNGYYDILAARVFAHETLERMAAVSQRCVINLLSESEHPVQALADLLTIRQEFESLSERTIGWVGDFSNVARSIAFGGAMLGASFRFGGPIAYGPTDEDIDRFAQLATGNATLTVFSRPEEAVRGVDVVSTDAWYSMGQEAQKAERRRAMEGCTVTNELMSGASPQAIFLHCLPAHRGEEVDNAVLEGSQSRIWQQAHNRLHSFRGLLTWIAQTNEHGLDRPRTYRVEAKDSGMNSGMNNGKNNNVKKAVST
jgi:ornithine carbamoyltransferase